MPTNGAIGEWLDDLKRCEDPPPDTTIADGKLIQRVVSKRVEDAEHYEPLLVSMGPIHHGKPHLQTMEKLKCSLAIQYATTYDESRPINNSISIDQLLLGARKYYSHSVHSSYSDHNWCQMMFKDACFFLEFVASEYSRTMIENWSPRRILDIKNLDRELVHRDLFLLENQLPFEVLDMFPSYFSIRYFEEDQFIAPFSFDDLIIKISGVFPTDPFGYRLQGPSDRELVPHEHLILRLRDLWINPSSGPTLKLYEQGDDEDLERNLVYYCPVLSVTELKKLGICCSRGQGRDGLYCFTLSEIHFKVRLLSGELVLPYLFIHEWTKTLLINLIAYESSSPDNSFMISSYLHFMGTLINREEDVKELRARGVVRSSIGDDQAVVQFFRDITAHVVKHDPRVFKHVQRDFSAYLRSKRQPLRVVLAEFKQRYFSGPWSFLVFLAVIFTLAMTIIQTVFTGIQTYK